MLFIKLKIQQQEVSCIVKRRSDFEHKINARGSDPTDYAKYAAYEMNLESLRKKRSKRFGVKTTNLSGQRQIFLVLERATRKFHGDMGLWMQYVSFARKQKSHKKVTEILTQMVRLFPTKPEIWIYAANYAMEAKGDMTEARSHMQKGLRLCKTSEKIWIEYARLEMMYIAKLAARSKILGLSRAENQQNHTNEGGKGVYDNAMNMSVITAKAADTPDVQDEGADQEAIGKLDLGSARLGAIPIAIFDAALKEFKDRSQFVWAFFDMIAEIDVAPRGVILSHIMDCMQSIAPNSFETLIRFVQQPVIGLDPTTSEYPMPLAASLDRLGYASGKLETMRCHHKFYEHMVVWVSKLIQMDDLDVDIRKVLKGTLKKLQTESRAMKA